MKKLTLILLTIVLFALSLSGCENSGAPNETDSGSNNAEVITDLSSYDISISKNDDNGFDICYELERDEDFTYEKYIVKLTRYGSVDSVIGASEETCAYLSNATENAIEQAKDQLAAIAQEYGCEPAYYLSIEENGTFLCRMEIIVSIEPESTSEEYIESGCNIDHEHKFFSQPILLGAP